MKIRCIIILCLFSCDDFYYGQNYDADPTVQIFSVRSNEQRIREDIVGSWKFRSVEIRTDSGKLYKITGDCTKPYRNYSSTVDIEKLHFDLSFGIDEQSLTQYFNCNDVMTPWRFRIIESRGRVYLSVNVPYAYDYEFTDAPYYISQTMTLKAINPPKGIASAVWVFTRD